MTEEFSGSVKSSEFLPPIRDRATAVGLQLRPIGNWETPIIVGTVVKLVLPDGSCYFSRVRGGEIMTQNAPAMLIEFIPAINNEVPEGTRVYMLNP